MRPSPAYLRAAAACVRAVAEGEGHPPEDVDADCATYETWAGMIEEGD